MIRRIFIAVLSVNLIFTCCIYIPGVHQQLKSKNFLDLFGYMKTTLQDKFGRPNNIVYFGQNESLARIFNTPEYIRNYSAKCVNVQKKTGRFELHGSDVQARRKWMKRFPQCIYMHWSGQSWN